MRPPLSFACSLTLMALLALPGTPVQAADSVRQLPPFIAINCLGPVNVSVEAGLTQSVRVSGPDAFVAGLKTVVVDRELTISLNDKSYQKLKGNAQVTITMPSLSRLKMEGAGETLLRNINGERLDISYQGAGHVEASGKVKYLRLVARGVGEVNTRALQAERVDVNFEGVGAVSVYASELLNAIARGMGTLEYYGHPRTVNKSVEGIGSVRAGD
ncbi:MAG: head GIN domain-containing protein [Sphingomonadaceae bacterium]